MTFAELSIGSFFTFSPGFIQYQKTSVNTYRTRLKSKPDSFKINDKERAVNEIN
jgi:hypothetical protein